MNRKQKDHNSQKFPFFVRFLEEEFSQELYPEMTTEKLQQIIGGRTPVTGRIPGQYTRAVGEEGRPDIV
jgi:bacteriocin-like protein